MTNQLFRLSDHMFDNISTISSKYLLISLSLFHSFFKKIYFIKTANNIISEKLNEVDRQYVSNVPEPCL